MIKSNVTHVFKTLLRLINHKKPTSKAILIFF